MINHISKVGIQSQTNTANVVVLDNIMEGVDGAATFGYSVTPGDLRVQDAQTQQYIHNHQLDVRVLRSSDADLEKLQVMEANNEPVKVTTLGVDGSVVFYDEAQMVRAGQYDQVLADRFLITRSTALGYVGDPSDTRYPVLGVTNDLMEIFDTSTGGPVTINGFGSSGAISAIQSGGIQFMTRTSSSGLSRVITRNLLWPFPGVSLTAQIEVTAISAPSSLLLLQAFNSSGSIISTNLNFSTTGIKTITLTMPAGVEFVNFYVNCGTTTGHNLQFIEPKLWINPQ